jgi:CelD/BcsL family acetyltransferase involved in cellulose biosynthesis
MSNETLVSEVGSRERTATVARPLAAGLPKKPKLSVVVAESWAELEPYVAGWERLAAAAVEANVFYEPWMFKPALESLGRGEKFVFVLVLAEVPPGSPHAPLVCGFFPLVRRRRYKCFPVSTLALWGHIHCYVCTPLLHAAYASECLHAFFEWMRTDRRGAALLECKWIPGEGPFHRLLVEHLVEQRLSSLVEGSYARALWCPRANAQAYLEEVLSGERRRRLRRHEERLKEEGKVEYAALTSAADARSWLEEFLRMEAAGWKGQEGTALQCREEDRRFFLDALMEAFQRGRLMMMGLHLNGRPIALFCDLLAEPWSFVFKLTFDEAYARFSPGALLELEKIRRLHERPEIRWADSCNAPGPSLLKELWADRRLIDMMAIASGKAPGPLVLALAPLLRWVRRTARGLVEGVRRLVKREPPAINQQPPTTNHQAG